MLPAVYKKLIKGYSAPLFVALCSLGLASCFAPAIETLEYLRVAGPEPVTDSTISLRSMRDWSVIRSITQRGQRKLTLTSRFDLSDRLLDGSVMLEEGGQARSATVKGGGGAVRVFREGQEVVELDCPPGVVVTSAPDWTDAYQITRRYDREKGGVQEFAGLWIHPQRQPFRLTFTLTPIGENRVTLKGQEVKLDRSRMELRGGSRYVAWRNASGQLVRLVLENNPRSGIVLGGWEEVTRSLNP